MNQRARCTSVIQVDVRGEDVCDVLWLKTCLANRCQQVFEHTAWTRVDDGKFIPASKEIGADDFWFTLEWQRNLPCTRAPLFASAFTAGIWSLLLSRDGFGLGEQEQVISAACFRVGAGHIEAAEGVDADKRTGGFAVEVEI